MLESVSDPWGSMKNLYHREKRKSGLLSYENCLVVTFWGNSIKNFYEESEELAVQYILGKTVSCVYWKDKKD